MEGSHIDRSQERGPNEQNWNKENQQQKATVGCWNSKGLLVEKTQKTKQSLWLT
jgi:hypothetical protein